MRPASTSAKNSISPAAVSKSRPAPHLHWIPRLLGHVALAGIVLWSTTFPAQAQGPAQSVASVRLYVFDSGRLKSGNPQPLLDRGVTVTDMSVATYLVVHPRGTLLWDTGTIPDDQIQPGGTTVARATVHKTLSGQLAEIGYKPADVTYLALSHYH